MRYRLTIFAFVMTLLPIGPSFAQVLYDNGPINGTTDSQSISSFFSGRVSDTFALAQTSTIGGFDLGVWEGAGDQVLTLDWEIYSDGKYYGSGTASVVDTFISVNQYGYDIDKLGVSLPNGPTLNAGSYWLYLTDAITKKQGLVYWDENSGIGCKGDDGKGGGCPSLAWESYGSTTATYPIPSEAFEITGTSSGSGTVPEPSSIVLFGMGTVGMVGLLRRRLDNR